ncbi:hypothetical protein KNV05_gp132 [Vibrio phage River4]|uniref:Uncharacterized protein n=1 Tax=Vibrio phage River4 TaxID=2736288 RepID=A0A6M9Z0T8_9CAUD|nr:hypothetical protein KNV05_gp132 [Vibrio phage River4]QKN84823.1 hypothetical protein RIVER4_184 [Vibrio phage River4]
MIRSIITDLLNAGFIGWFILAIGTFLAFLMLWGIFIAVDSVGIDTRSYVVQAYAKKYHPAYTTTTMVSNGNGGMTPVIQYHPERWTASIAYEGNGLSCEIDQLTYHQLKLPQEVVAHIGQGRITAYSYCTGIQL